MSSIKRGSGTQLIHIATAAVTEGDIIEFTNVVARASKSGAIGDRIPCDVVAEVEADKESGVTIAAGDQVFWDAANNRVDKTGTNIPMGVAAADAGSSATRCSVLLNVGTHA